MENFGITALHGGINTLSIRHHEHSHPRQFNLQRQRILSYSDFRLQASDLTPRPGDPVKVRPNLGLRLSRSDLGILTVSLCDILKIKNARAVPPLIQNLSFPAEREELKSSLNL